MITLISSDITMRNTFVVKYHVYSQENDELVKKNSGIFAYVFFSNMECIPTNSSPVSEKL